jgi:hypothetical protein
MSNLGAHTKPSGKRVELLGSTVHIDDLAVPLNEAAEYLREIPSEKRELAFVHAVQVGMAEIIARRKRFSKNGHSAFALAAPPVVDAGKPAEAGPSTSREREDNSVKEEMGNDLPLQPASSPPLEPTTEIAAEPSSEKYVSATPLQEPDGWLRRLDEDFEILDKLQAIDASRTGR